MGWRIFCNFARNFRPPWREKRGTGCRRPTVKLDNQQISMYAIVEIKGQQFKAEEGKYLYVHHLGDEVKAGDAVEFEKVLLLDADGDVKIGVPAVEGAKVSCEVLEPLVKGDKVLVFKKKRRKGYRRLNGHRQQFTKVLVKNIVKA